MFEERMQELELRHRSLTIRLDAFERKLDENSVTTDRVDTNTKELVSILKSWKGAFQVLDFLGKVAKPVAAILGVFAALYAIFHTTRP